MLIPPALLTEYPSSYLKIYIAMAERELESIQGKYYFEMEDALELFITQHHNALKIVMANEKIYQS